MLELCGAWTLFGDAAVVTVVVVEAGGAGPAGAGGGADALVGAGADTLGGAGAGAPGAEEDDVDGGVEPSTKSSGHSVQDTWVIGCGGFTSPIWTEEKICC